MPRRIHFADTAEADLTSLLNWITAEATADVALAYVARIEAACLSLADFPRRGTLRKKLPEVRSIAFEQRATIIYRVGRGEVVILNVIHAGRDVAAAVQR